MDGSGDRRATSGFTRKLHFVAPHGGVTRYSWISASQGASKPFRSGDGPGRTQNITVLEIAAHIVAAIAAPADAMTPSDERDRYVAAKAKGFAFLVLSAVVFIMIAELLLGMTSWAACQSLVLAFVVGELVRYGAEISLLPLRQSQMTRPVANQIRRFRFERDEMTQQELADRIGVTRQTVNAIDLGKYSPSLEVAFRITLVFGVPLEEVFEYTGERP